MTSVQDLLAFIVSGEKSGVILIGLPHTHTTHTHTPHVHTPHTYTHTTHTAHTQSTHIYTLTHTHRTHTTHKPHILQTHTHHSQHTQYLSTNPALQRIINGKAQHKESSYTLEEARN